MTRRLPDAFWHAIPLHYAPYLLFSGGLLSQARLAGANLPIRPRPTAFRRDRRLHLDDYIHLSLEPQTPLLADKRGRGYHHLLIEFARGAADLPGAAFLAYNTKAWRHREDFAPVAGVEEKAAFLAAWQMGSYPSAELLVPGALPLVPHCRAFYAASDSEAGWLRDLAAALLLPLPAPLQTSSERFPPGLIPDLSPYAAYAAACREACAVLPPPDMPFD